MEVAFEDEKKRALAQAQFEHTQRQDALKAEHDVKTEDLKKSLKAAHSQEILLKNK